MDRLNIPHNKYVRVMLAYDLSGIFDLVVSDSYSLVINIESPNEKKRYLFSTATL